MKKSVYIKNLSFAYDDKVIFHNLNLDIRKGKWVTIIGSNGSGKSSLMSLMSGLCKFDGKITIEEKEFVNDFHFKTKNVKDELNYYLSKYYIKNDEQKEIFDALNIENIMDLDIVSLDFIEKYLLSLAICLIKRPRVLLFDGLLELDGFKRKEKIVNLLKKYNKKGMTIINSTVNVEDSLIGDDIIVISNNEVILEGPKEKVFLNEKEFKKCGLELPFIVDLSIKLKYYGVVDKIYFDMGKLIDDIWH